MTFASISALLQLVPLDLNATQRDMVGAGKNVECVKVKKDRIIAGLAGLGEG